MTPKQERFVAEYLVDLNATQAAIRCGYSAKTAKQQGSRLLSNADVAAAVANRTQAINTKIGLSAELVLENIRRPLVADVRKMFKAGNALPIEDLSDEEAHLVGGYEMIVKNAKAGDGHVDEVLKMRLVDRAKYVEMGAKYFKLLTDQVNHSGDITFKWAD